MRKYLLILFLFVLGPLNNVYGQKLTEVYFNFYHENEKVIWRTIFEKGITNVDVENLIKSKKGLKLIESDTSKVSFDIEDLLYAGDYTLSGRVVIEIKIDRYRVSVSDITYKPGASAQAMQAAILGTTMNFIGYANKDFIKRDLWRKSNANIEAMDKNFKSLFLLPLQEQNSKW